MRGVLIVIAKECLPGRVKTRLTPPLTAVQAAQIAQVSLNQTIRTALAVPDVHRLLFLDGAIDGLLQFFPHLREEFTIISQPAGDLDVRLGYVFDQVRDRFGDLTPTALIGMDTPQVSADALNTVFENTFDDSWLGFTDDGGYWLIGMRKPRGDVIRGVTMSRADTGQRQLASMNAAALHPRMLPSLVDIDHWADAQRVASMLPGSALAQAVDAFTHGQQASSSPVAFTPHQ